MNWLGVTAISKLFIIIDRMHWIGRTYQSNRRAISIAVILLIWLIILILLSSGAFSPSVKEQLQLPLTFFIASTSIFFTLFEIQRHSNLQRAAFIQDHIATYYKTKELRQTFHDLIYLYSESEFDRIHSPKNPSIRYNDAKKKLNEFYETKEGEVNYGKESGRRLYHISRFQGSEEERRLDELLYFFEIIAYHIDHNLIRQRDVDGTVGHLLRVLSKKKCIDKYLELIEISTGGKHQFTHLYGLLKELKLND